MVSMLQVGALGAWHYNIITIHTCLIKHHHAVALLAIDRLLIR